MRAGFLAVKRRFSCEQAQTSIHPAQQSIVELFLNQFRQRTYEVLAAV